MDLRKALSWCDMRWTSGPISQKVETDSEGLLKDRISCEEAPCRPNGLPPVRGPHPQLMITAGQIELGEKASWSMSCAHSPASSPSDNHFTCRDRGIRASPVSSSSSIPRSGGMPGGAPPSPSANLTLSAANAGSLVPTRCSSASARQKDARWSFVPSLSTSTPSAKRSPY